jgi:hypothetical protein
MDQACVKEARAPSAQRAIRCRNLPRHEARQRSEGSDTRTLQGPIEGDARICFHGGMDRADDLALQALQAAAGLPRPRRRWSDGPRYTVAEEGRAGDGAPEDEWPMVSACSSEAMAEVAAAMRHELARLQHDGRLHPSDAAPLADLTASLTQFSRTLQQIVRLGGGRVQLAAERVDLVALVRETVHDMRDEARRRGADVNFEVRPAEVLIDPSLALELLRTMTLAVRGELLRGRDRSGRGGTARRNRRAHGSLDWVLLRQIAAHAQVQVARTSSPLGESVVVEFGRTYQTQVEGMVTVEMLGETIFSAPGSSPWVLAVIADGALRAEVVDLLLRNGFDAQAVAHCDEARALCASRVPTVLVGCEQGHGLEQLRRDWLAHGHRCGHIHVMRETPSFHLHGFSGSDLVRIGRRDVQRELVPAVLFEIAHQE